jgi:CBS domain-containing protein
VPVVSLSPIALPEVGVDKRSVDRASTFREPPSTMKAVTVRDLVHAGLVTCPRATKLGDAASLLVRHKVHALVVVDGEGNPVGVPSDFDLLAGEWLGHRSRRSRDSANHDGRGAQNGSCNRR